MFGEWVVKILLVMSVFVMMVMLQVLYLDVFVFSSVLKVPLLATYRVLAVSPSLNPVNGVQGKLDKRCGVYV